MSQQQQEEYKSVIITGCNSGIGLEAVRQLLREEWDSNRKTKHIVMACRGVELSNSEMETFIQDYLKEHPERNETELKSQITALKLDLASFKSIHQFVSEIKSLIDSSKIPPLHSLVCNAGLQYANKLVLTEEGYEATFGVNHLGHFLLINLLLPLFTKSTNSKNRIVIVSSDTHDRTKFTGMPVPEFETAEKLAIISTDSDTEQDNSKLGRVRYTTSKFCNILCAYELVTRLQSHPIYRDQFTVNSFNPGFVPTTGLSRDYNKFLRAIARNVLPLLRFVHSGVRTLEVSGYDLKQLIIDRNLENVTGKYFDGSNMIDSSPDTYNTTIQNELWEDSIKLIIAKSDIISKTNFL
ncbi:predicted protein [Naegleria gruberi]|uniref:Predicted protein n=1 Tax=Naegleria gruberi TaxID=5762 RepID=D2VH75_NAEGR|nr:uncharacterized protein NAEGRDRAFT_68301 [Naegleria gruberi]EFC43844.1 predicted protein [Naegleria gruberi]|eukprot:XP_002676588.1 predicted protein [Naegleria gruberi strain NEG-M]